MSLKIVKFFTLSNLAFELPRLEASGSKESFCCGSFYLSLFVQFSAWICYFKLMSLIVCILFPSFLERDVEFDCIRSWSLPLLDVNPASVCLSVHLYIFSCPRSLVVFFRNHMPNTVQVCRQIWLPSTTFHFSL